MSRITSDSRAIWRTVTRQGGWWTVRRLVEHWRPAFTAADVHAHCAALAAAGFLARCTVRAPIAGLLYAYGYTPACHPLPGEPMPPLVCDGLPAAAAANTPPAAPQRAPLELHWTVARPGALDHLSIR